MPPTDLYLVRHGQSTWNATGRWQGQADPPLSDHGRAQAFALAGNFPDAAVTHVVTSDLGRARATAEPIAARFGVEPVVDADLREIDVGSWSGKTRDEIRAEDAASLELYFQGQVGWTGGESYEAHETRSGRAARSLEGLDSDGAVIAVTHGGTMRALILELLQIDPNSRWRFTGIGHGSVTHLSRGAYGWRLVFFNRVPCSCTG